MEHGNHEFTAYDSDGKARDPATLTFLERISWFERQRPIAADNDNADTGDDAACFQSWAMPDFMRK